jgi:hypothetical protein
MPLGFPCCTFSLPKKNQKYKDELCHSLMTRINPNHNSTGLFFSASQANFAGLFMREGFFTTSTST